MMLEHPDITWARATGYPHGYEEPEDIYCPVCGAENPEKLYRFRGDHDWLGCSECIWNTLQALDCDDVRVERMEANE